MTVIDRTLMLQATETVAMLTAQHPCVEWHTLTITLNGQHGGADVTLDGSNIHDCTPFHALVVLR